ncbi:MAG: hypothetical protein JSW70_04300 [Syntrophobacterales bacterium]|nr:MAG: hypothetical protein JSW70_04300 [Syntrophobacterales bacterium]
MVRSRKFIGIYLVLGVLCAPSCVKEIGNVETEYFYGDYRGDSVVLGRIGVVEEGVEKSWESPRIDPSTKTSFQIFIGGWHSELKVSHFLRGNGYFCLRLPPGEYNLWRWVYQFPGGHANTIGPLSVYFDVLPGNTIYIGTLYIHLPPVSSMSQRSFGSERAKPRYDIVDEYVMAMAFWRDHYPHFPHSVERHLMRFFR